MMDIPTGWEYYTTTMGGREITDHTTAFFDADDVTIQVTYQSPNLTTMHVRERGIRAYDFERGGVIEWGTHPTPADAFRTAAAYIADGGDDYQPISPRRTSDRYARAVAAAYAEGIRERYTQTA